MSISDECFFSLCGGTQSKLARLILNLSPMTVEIAGTSRRACCFCSCWSIVRECPCAWSLGRSKRLVTVRRPLPSLPWPLGLKIEKCAIWYLIEGGWPPKSKTYMNSVLTRFLKEQGRNREMSFVIRHWMLRHNCEMGLHYISSSNVVIQ